MKKIAFALSLFVLASATVTFAQTKSCCKKDAACTKNSKCCKDSKHCTKSCAKDAKATEKKAS